MKTKVNIMIMMTKLTVTVLKGVLKVMKLSLIAIIMENIWIMEVKMKMSMKFKTKKKKSDTT